MKNLTLLFLLLHSAAFAQFQYVSPMPGSKMSNINHNIIIRPGSLLDASSLSNKLFSVEGTRSGIHDFKIVLARDGKTIILQPVTPFSYSEEVTVRISAGLKTVNRKTLSGYSFSFSTHREYSLAEQEQLHNAKQILMKEELQRNGYDESTAGDDEGDLRDITGGFTIVNNTNPTPGEIFFDAWGGFGFSTKFDGYNIIEPNGDSVYYSAKRAYDFDFDVNPNGYLSVYNTNYPRYDILDSSYAVIDYYYPANGYTMDVHEFTLTADGNAWFIADDPEIVDMTVYNSGYCHNATVTGTVIQELDPDKNLIFEWNSFDHVAITESLHENLSSCVIDYMHTNSLDFDANGNLVVSNRHLDQVNKIDPATGDFIWRLGGISNEFTWVDEPEPFTYEHCVRVLDNGNLTVWDNGNYHVPTHSMAKEYQLDEVNKVATLVWSYQPKTYSNGNAYWFAMGSVQRLSNGNTLIGGGWDFSSNQSNFFEVTPTDSVVWEMALNNGKSLVSYRAAKRNWKPCAPVNPATITVKKITATSAKIAWSTVHNATSYDLQFRRLNNVTWKVKNTTNTSKKLEHLLANKSYEFQVRAYCSNGYISDWSPLDTFKTLPLKLTDTQREVSATVELNPNPTSGLLNIQFALEEDQQVTLSIYNVEGKMISTSSQFLTAGDQSLQLDETSLPAGFYLAEIKVAGDKQIVKFVKE
ncbi:MAG TPA: arylsulfotransferase family protein [Chitinophagales bacterium]|nr:arylsulfotransferase family protein [Chitinophagales bacterium]